MAHPKIEKLLADIIEGMFQIIKESLEFYVNDTFDSLTDIERSEIATYLQRKAFTQDIRSREESTVFIMPHNPLLDKPMPQIGINSGTGNTATRFLGTSIGEAVPYPDAINQTHWATPHGYMSDSTYEINVVAASKIEAIWLSRLVQRMIMSSQDDLQEFGLAEISTSVRDMELATGEEPMTVFNRQITMTCKAMRTWTKLVELGTYQAGKNEGL